jgi:hypothetical protein
MNLLADCACRPFGGRRNSLVPAAATTLLLVLASGCRSRFVQTSVENDTDQPLRVVELDYPGASFGVSILAPHAAYNYRFKAIGSGPLALSYTETTGAARTSTGPVVNDGQGGSLVVHIRDHGAVKWEPALSGH